MEKRVTAMESIKDILFRFENHSLSFLQIMSDSFPEETETFSINITGVMRLPGAIGQGKNIWKL